MRPVSLVLALCLAAPFATAQSLLFTPAPSQTASLSPQQSGFLDALSAHPGVDDFVLLVAHPDRLSDAEILLPLPDGPTIKIKTTQRQKRESGRVSYVGREANESESILVILVASEEGWLTGTIWASGAVYTVRPLTGGLHAIATVNTEAFPEYGDDTVDGEHDSIQDAPQSPRSSAGIVEVDVLVPYMANVARAFADPVALAQASVDLSNETFVNSQVEMRFNLVHAYETGESVGSDRMTLDFRAAVDPADGLFDEIYQYRDAYAADVIAMIGSGLSQYVNDCGQAIVDSEVGMAVSVSSYDCAVENITFPHEIGHNFGARHGRGNLEIEGPFAYGHGAIHEESTEGPSWRTVMRAGGFFTGPYERAPYWSSPNVTFRGVASGDAVYADNARVLNEQAEYVAGFRTTRSPFPASSVAPAAVNVTFGEGETGTVTVRVANTAVESAQDLSASLVLQRLSTVGPSIPGTQSDAFGYRWIDSSEPSGPEFAWTDIRSTGTSHSLGDQGTVVVDLPFAFKLYETEYSQLTVSIDGYLTFGEAFVERGNTAIPSETPPNAFIAPFWDDLAEGLGGGRVHTLTEAERVTVQYTNVSRQAEEDGFDIENTFQVVLLKDGGILFQYLELNAENLEAASVGIENRDGSIGIQVAYQEPFLADEKAVRFIAPVRWVAVSDQNVNISAQSGRDIMLTFDTAGVPVGEYTADLEIDTNDIDDSVITVPIRMTVIAASAGEETGAREAISLGTPRPNPARGSATIPYTLAEAGTVRMIVLDILGREVLTLEEGRRRAGSHSATLDATGLAPGLYIVRLQASGVTMTQRIVVS